ncbi:RNA polymerase sigma-70 factor (ECF subfamily) [Arcticibacter pallidicorallinus]|uniref:RNA polymerase sigma-70 factor (ECF subfamily) n=1 Tax=Arcticibacter pallidicorallinus TaxID=1259464 RepID=A0A2T0TW43_9SPHI|nr:RNA polymerase sigma-70 factor [Arcticibacter pallidicorallinus]PRY49881.1 RNA polymerase sigma-70 factor (ECF subfamily) [Arcticibacter pallidicorallinus]
MRQYIKFSDSNLLALLKQGDIVAFEELYERYWSKLYSAGYKRLGNREAAEEIVQDIFTSLWIKRSSLVVNSSFENYLYSSVKYMVFASFQKESNRKTYENYVAHVHKDIDNSTVEAIDWNELTRNVGTEVEKLPEKCRKVYELSRKEFRSNKEIAFSLGISEKTVENHLTRALRTLRVNLKQVGTLLLSSLLSFF